MTTGYVGPNGQFVTVADTPANAVPQLRNVAPPASAGAAGEAGNFAYDANFLYICIATNTWMRVGISTW